MNKSAVLIACGVFVLFSAHAFAACTSPAGVAAEVFYNSAESTLQYCNGSQWIAMGPVTNGPGGNCASPAAAPGTLVYNADYHVPQFCNGGQWVAMGPVPGAGGAGCASPSGIAGTMIYNSDAAKMQYCDGTNWVALDGFPSSVQGYCDDPTAFDFTDVTGVEPSTLTTSAILQISGLTCFANVSISGDGSPEFRICNASDCSIVDHTWGSVAQALDNGQYLQLRNTSSPSLSTTVTATVNVGQGSDSWRVTTRACDTTPTAFAFTDLTDQAQSTVVESDIVQVTGIDTVAAGCGASVTLSGDASAEYRVCNDGTCSANPAWGTSGQTIDNNQYIQARVTTGSSPGAVSSATVDVGGVSDTFSATTVPEVKTVFVATNSGVGYTGGLGGVTSANSFCATEASGAGLSGTYKAWIADSTGSNDPIANFTGVGGGFRYKLPSGTVIADSWADLTDGTLDAGINQNASGAAVGANSVWANVTTGGDTLSTNTNQGACQDWVSNATNRKGQEGTVGAATSAWTDNATATACNASYYLYCFQQ